MRCDVRAAIAQIVVKEVSGFYSYEGEVNQDGDMHGKGFCGGGAKYLRQRDVQRIRELGMGRHGGGHGPYG